MTKTDRDKLVLSPSRVKTYEQCPRKYYYSYVEHLPRKEWDHFDLGHLAHGALEHFHENYRDDKNPPDNMALLMKTAFQKQWNSMETESKVADSAVEEAKKLLREYIRGLKSNGIGSKILSLEKDFKLPLNKNYDLRGVIDRLDLDEDGIYHIKDYKTNKNPKYMDAAQLRAYGIYLLDTYPEIDRFRGSYIMLRFSGMNISYDFNKEDVIKERKRLIEIGDRITEEERWITKPSRLCDWCDYKDPCFNTW